jgi:ATP/maltotriose-dependent transcriptional regulator MalT
MTRVRDHGNHHRGRHLHRAVGTMAGMSDTGVLAESGISAREAGVLTALGEHLTNAEIGAELFIPMTTSRPA